MAVRRRRSKTSTIIKLCDKEVFSSAKKEDKKVMMIIIQGVMVIHNISSAQLSSAQLSSQAEKEEPLPQTGALRQRQRPLPQTGEEDAAAD